MTPSDTDTDHAAWLCASGEAHLRAFVDPALMLWDHKDSAGRSWRSWRDDCGNVHTVALPEPRAARQPEGAA